MIEINNRPLSDFSLTLLKGEAEALCFPPTKPPKINDWGEENGTEVDLSRPVVDKKSVELELFCSDFSRFEEFLGFIGQRNFFRLNFGNFETSLRLNEIKTLKRSGNFASFSLEAEQLLYDVLPSWEAPPTQNGTENIYLDDENWATLGVHLLFEAREILYWQQTKPAVRWGSATEHGYWENGFASNHYKKSQAVRLPCLIVEQERYFYNRYSDFFQKWIQPQQRTITIGEKSFFCYYKSTKINELLKQNGKIYCSFEVEIEIISEKYRIFDPTFDNTFN